MHCDANTVQTHTRGGASTDGVTHARRRVRRK